MKTIDAHNTNAKQAFIAALRARAIVVFPTDTIYGIGCRADDIKALERVYRLKKRTDPKMPLLVSSVTMAKRYVRISKRNEALLRRHWPAALTAVLPSKNQLPYTLEGETGTLSIRVPNDDFLRSVIRSLGVPLVATSANVAGNNPIENEKELRAQFQRLPDVFVDGGKPKNTKPSTLVDLTGEEIKVIRQGKIEIQWKLTHSAALRS